MLPTVTGPGALAFAVQLKALTDQEFRYQPKLSGLRIIETAHDNGLRMTARLREYEVKDLLSLTRFFGFSAETFSLAVNLLDRFLAVMKIQPKHLSCVGLSCFYIAVKTTEEKKNVPMANELIRISQNRFTVSDMMRMEKIILQKLYWKVKAPTALYFLRLFYRRIQDTLEDDCKEIMNVERLEAQLKACHCSFTFSKVKPSLLALSLLALELQEQHDHEHIDKLLNTFQCLQQQLTPKVPPPPRLVPNEYNPESEGVLCPEWSPMRLGKSIAVATENKVWSSACWSPKDYCSTDDLMLRVHGKCRSEKETWLS
ncbi:cyclin-G1 isoform X2 [Oncorhynchus tshawytscha]|uniref:cyclin-G1 isoform X2 n=1 Tax=Oncorhynchus tshawytscha TaxID=74940 RepID=UPI000D09AB9F|nr:cyclin-G1 isoform X2 [Oncorhynchus tshawytscha]